MIRLKKASKIQVMLQRFILHFALVFLFAFTQLGIATHEISHLNEFSQHSQQDKKAPAEVCSKCLSYSQVASGLQSPAFTLPNIEAGFASNSSDYLNVQHSLQTAYAARAPPQIASI